jgi:hypothetical protein
MKETKWLKTNFSKKLNYLFMMCIVLYHCQISGLSVLLASRSRYRVS